MKFEKPFHIKIQPYYCIKEPTVREEIERMKELTQKFGGQNLVDDESGGHEETKILRSGGRMDWNLFSENNSHKPEINIHLMRIWAVQMVTQMINEKAFVNEVHSEPRFGIDEEDKEIFLNTIQIMTRVLNDELEKANDSIIIKKKNKFNFNKHGE